MSVQRRNSELVDLLRPDFVGNDGTASPSFVEVRLSNQLVIKDHVIRSFFYKYRLTDGVATDVFRISTTNEPNAGGGYSCLVHAVITDGAFGHPQTASASFVAQFARAMASVGTGGNSAVSEVCEVVVAPWPANRDITSITMSLVETTEFDIDVQFTVVQAGASADRLGAWVSVELVWGHFLTQPTMTQL